MSFRKEIEALAREELGAKVRRLQETVAEIGGMTQLDGVTIWTDANGRLTRLDVDHDAYARGPSTLVDLIMRAYEQTAEDVQQRTATVLAELREDPIVARIADAADDSNSTELRSYSERSRVQSANRTPDEFDEPDSYYRRKSWLE